MIPSASPRRFFASRIVAAMCRTDCSGVSSIRIGKSLKADIADVTI